MEAEVVRRLVEGVAAVAVPRGDRVRVGAEGEERAEVGHQLPEGEGEEGVVAVALRLGLVVEAGEGEGVAHSWVVEEQ